MGAQPALELKKPPTIQEALVAKFCAPHYITLFEVRDSTGYDSTRAADCIAIGLYRSRGRELTGFEIKTARSDWLRELKNPEKAEEIGKFCEWFYLVTNTDQVARIDEIPGPWGWMVLAGEKLKVLKKPERMKPVALDRHMLCSLLLSVRKQAMADIEVHIQSVVEKGIKEKHSALIYRAENAENERIAIENRVKEFEEASGLSIRFWLDKPQKIGAAVRRLMEDEDALKKYKTELERIIRQAKCLSQNIESELEALNKEASGVSA